MNDAPNRDVQVFTEALRLPADQRAAYLERACGGDAGMRERVEVLLKAHESVGDFLEQSPRLASSAARTSIPAGEKSGDHIGRYKLLQQIGEGGWGVVYLAEQKEPVRRRVALKIIKPGMDTKSVIARFEAERQALALMDHPNIAKVFDAGATESGRPYFVMELVRGIKITDYCDQNSLTTAERLCLFVQVCQAVQHAHQKGIIHRDIKPSNILVTTSAEGAAVPVVIDFGIAKATTNQQLTDKTLFTVSQMLIGTPAYMSPEQAALTSVDVDTRTDIYSLGVLLYELLTGTPPFDTAELLKVGFDEIRRVIREQEPARPSTKLSKLTGKDLAKAAGHRNMEPPRLIRSLRGDLDWIVMKALEKDRKRRYETANGLSLDVQRFLANETVLARPPNLLYRFQKAVLRNKLVFAGLGIIALLLVAGLAVVLTLLARERTALREAEAQSAKSQQITQFLENMLQGVGPSAARGRDTTMLREILDRTADNVSAGMTNQPAVEAQLRSLVGRLYLEIGDYDKAEQMHRAELALCQARLGSNSRETAGALNDLGLTLARENKFAEAEGVDQDALRVWRRQPGDEDSNVAASLSSLAEMYAQLGKITQAEPLIRQALAIRQKCFGDQSLEVADSLRSLSIVLGDEGKWNESETLARRVLTIRRQILGPLDPKVATSLTDVAWAVGAQHRLDEAESLEQEALTIRRKVLGVNHPDVAKSLYLMGERMRERNDLDDAYSYLSSALAMQRQLLGEDNPTTLDTMRSLGMTLEAQGRLAEAESIHRQAVALWRKRGDPEIPQAITEVVSLVHLLIAQKKFADAEQYLDDILPPQSVAPPGTADLLALKVDLEGRQQRWRQAAADAGQLFEQNPENNGNYCTLAALLIKSGDLSGYSQYCHRLLALATNTDNIFAADAAAKACLLVPVPGLDLKAVGRLSDFAVTHGSGDEGARPFFEICKALSEYRQGHYADAADWAEKTLISPRLDAHGHACAILSMADWQLGQKDMARTILAEGNALVPPGMPASATTDSGNAWLFWLITRISLDEADALIQPDPPPDHRPNGPGAGP